MYSTSLIKYLEQHNVTVSGVEGDHFVIDAEYSSENGLHVVRERVKADLGSIRAWLGY